MTDKPLEIEYIDEEGRGVASSGGRRFFAYKTAPGDLISPRQIAPLSGGEKYEHILVRNYDLIRPSSQRIKPRCPFYERCGGCSMMHLDYGTQLAWKTALVRSTLARVAKISEPSVRETLPSPERWYYRNKIRHGFINENEFVRFARHSPLSELPNVPITRCYLCSPRSNEVFAEIALAAQTAGLTAWTKKNHDGYLRHAIYREGKYTKEFMIDLFCEKYPPEKALRVVVAALVRKFAGRLKSLWISTPSQSKLYYGQSFFSEELHCGATRDKKTFKFNVSREAFFQTNTLQAEQIYSLIARTAATSKNEIIFDLYGGTGTIGCVLSSLANKVYTIESNPEAVRDAHENIARNHTNNVRSIKGDALEEALSLARKNLIPDFAVIDPPRAGLSTIGSRRLLELLPPKLVYVSCNLASAARDLRRLSENRYLVDWVQPLDMFPQSHQIEIVAALKLV